MNAIRNLFSRRTQEPNVNVNIENNVKVLTGGRRNWSNFKSFESNADDDKYLRLTHSMMSSAAWKSLSIYARYLYIEMKAKYNGSNQNDISFTHTEAEGLMSKPTFIKSRDQLIECGFIELIEHNPTSRRRNIYGFTDMWKLYGTRDFKVNPRERRNENAHQTN